MKQPTCTRSPAPFQGQATSTGAARASATPGPADVWLHSVSKVTTSGGTAEGVTTVGAADPGSPVFVIGAPRSGTTGFAKALASHPDFWAGAETKFLRELFGREIARVWEREQQRSTPTWLAQQGVSLAEFHAHIGSGVDSLMTSRSGGRRWIDHTPGNTLIADVIAQLFPTARFVYLLRDGRRVTHSLMNFLDVFPPEQRAAVAAELPLKTRDFATAVASWREMVRAGSAFVADNPDRCLEVRTDVLAVDPAEGFRRVLMFVGAADHPLPARRFASGPVNSSFGGRPPADPWSLWDDDQRRTFREIAGEDMVRLGFATDAEMTA